MRTALLQTNTSMDDVRKQIEERIRWEEFLRTKATDAELRKYVANHRDLFRGTQIRASHILIKVEPNASEADKEKVKQKLASIKKEIEGGTITFRGGGQQVFRRSRQRRRRRRRSRLLLAQHGSDRRVHRRRIQIEKGDDLRPRRDSVRLSPDPGHRPQRGQGAGLRAKQAVHLQRSTRLTSRKRSLPPRKRRPRSTSSRCRRTSSHPKHRRLPLLPAGEGRRLRSAS